MTNTVSFPRSHSGRSTDISTGHHHDTHASPPQALCNLYKRYQRMEDVDIDEDPDIVDFSRGLTQKQQEKLTVVDAVPSDLIYEASEAFRGISTSGEVLSPRSMPAECKIYGHEDFDGLRIYYSLIPPESQNLLVSRLFHRDLSTPLHKTNICHDYAIPFPPATPGSSHPGSFFTYPQSNKSQMFNPLNPHSNHKPINNAQFLQRKLRWLTIGDQYDWSTRAYPSRSPTPFPSDIGDFVKTLFQDTLTPQAGVLVVYSSKDYLPVHRDVSEECQRGLASISLGCDGLFIISRDRFEDADETDEEREMEMLVLRVRSGDVIQMGGKTRWCWHAMPKVMARTCPKFLDDWPVCGVEGEPKMYEKWRGFMKGKRLNLSCRQVWS